jgi:phosphohistidine phosphatase
MNLYMMRHADAGVPRDNPLLDARRGLIKEGKQQCMLMAGVLAGLKVQIDVIVASPLKRARQTAQFMATEIGFEAPVISSGALAPEGDYAAFQQLLSEHAAREGVLMVGHNPNLHQFLTRLLAGNGNGHGQYTGSGCVRMRKGGIARVDMSRRPPQLQWLIDPRLARVIYTSVTKSSRPKTSRK